MNLSLVLSHAYCCSSSSFLERNFFHPWLIFHWLLSIRSTPVSSYTFHFEVYQPQTWPYPFLREHLQVISSFFSFGLSSISKLICILLVANVSMNQVASLKCSSTLGITFIFLESGFILPQLILSWQLNV